VAPRRADHTYHRIRANLLGKAQKGVPARRGSTFFTEPPSADENEMIVEARTPDSVEIPFLKYELR
jgi:hypothetical protein